MTQGRVDQVTASLALRNHDDRLRALEASGPYLQFDKYPQDGTFLYVKATGSGGPNHVGIDLESAGGIFVNDNSSNGVVIQQQGAGGLTLEDEGSGSVLLAEQGSGGLVIRNGLSTPTGVSSLSLQDYSNGGIALTTLTAVGGGDGGITLTDQGAGTLKLNKSGAGNLEITNRNGSGGGTLVIDTTSGCAMTIQGGTDGILITTTGGGDVVMGGDALFLTANATPASLTQVWLAKVHNKGAFAFQNEDTSANLFGIDYNGVIHMDNLPTSAAGLPSGSIWDNAGVLNRVP